MFEDIDDLSVKPEVGNSTKPLLSPVRIFKGDCDKNIHWYIGCYSNGVHYYNECAYCGKRKSIEIG